MVLKRQLFRLHYYAIMLLFTLFFTVQITYSVDVQVEPNSPPVTCTCVKVGSFVLIIWRYIQAGL